MKYSKVTQLEDIQLSSKVVVMSDNWKKMYLTLKVRHTNLEEDLERLLVNQYGYLATSTGKDLVILINNLEEAEKYKERGWEVHRVHLGEKL